MPDADAPPPKGDAAAGGGTRSGLPSIRDSTARKASHLRKDVPNPISPPRMKAWLASSRRSESMSAWDADPVRRALLIQMIIRARARNTILYALFRIFILFFLRCNCWAAPEPWVLFSLWFLFLLHGCVGQLTNLPTLDADTLCIDL
jgi:hypothetical protein